MHFPGIDTTSRWTQFVKSLHHDLVFSFCCFPPADFAPTLFFLIVEIIGSIRYSLLADLSTVGIANDQLDLPQFQFLFTRWWVPISVTQSFVLIVHLKNNLLLFQNFLLDSASEARHSRNTNCELQWQWQQGKRERHTHAEATSCHIGVADGAKI